jgi:hypothetical protein
MHYVADSYECPALVVGTSNHFRDPEDSVLQYGHDGSEKLGFTVSVQHPFSRTEHDAETGDPYEVPLTELKIDPPWDPLGQTPGSWHWPDECHEED